MEKQNTIVINDKEHKEGLELMEQIKGKSAEEVLSILFANKK